MGLSPGVAPPGDVDFMQLSKIRGAANGKVETSRGREKVGARVYASAAGVSLQADFRVKREPLKLLYRKEKRPFVV
jgi:hypothetical protein